ncbi:MAG TPA: transcriptional activator NhaR [Anaeromyxobacteraceae bacterium]|nr:transcriptional activator NhaR [Anaeromyxobacteraceae bacterium]
MEWLNYHHLYYFWTVARAGSIARASEELRLSQPTISNQLKTLEGALGQKLFERQGRRLVLTDVGRTALRYADDIFRTGRELQQALRGQTAGDRLRLVVGVADVIPKMVAERLLQPAVSAGERVALTCREAPLAQLLGQLALHEIDVVLSDAPAPEGVKVRAYSHLLVECGVVFLAAPKLAGARKGFPRSLEGAPFLLPSAGTALRHGLERWFQAQGVRPEVTGEFDDAALLTAFGRRGLGLFAAPAVIEREVCDELGVQPVGHTDDVRERYYAITVERRLRHPAVVAIAAGARERATR